MKEKWEFTLHQVDSKEFLKSGRSQEVRQVKRKHEHGSLIIPKITDKGTIKELKEFQQECGLIEVKRRVLQEGRMDDS